MNSEIRRKPMTMQQVAKLADGEVIDVVFKKYINAYAGGVVAIFPYLVCCKRYRKKAVCHAYAFPIIRHAQWSWYVKHTTCASKEEREPWVEKLVEQYPKINFNIIERVSMDKYNELAKTHEALRELKR